MLDKPTITCFKKHISELVLHLKLSKYTPLIFNNFEGNRVSRKTQVESKGDE
jgi:hypothetical protein